MGTLESRNDGLQSRVKHLEEERKSLMSQLKCVQEMLRPKQLGVAATRSRAAMMMMFFLMVASPNSESTTTDASTDVASSSLQGACTEEPFRMFAHCEPGLRDASPYHFAVLVVLIPSVGAYLKKCHLFW